MEKEIYTPMEKVLIEGIKTKQKLVEAAELDLLLLEMEKQFDLMDGLKEEAYLL